MHTLATAAKATGLNKSTVLRAIKAGKVSATKDEHGEWQIDAAELHRVYPVVADAPGRTSAAQRYATPAAPDAPDAPDATALLEAQIASMKDMAVLLRDQLADVKQDRDAWRSQAEANQRLLASARPRGGVFSRLFGKTA